MIDDFTAVGVRPRTVITTLLDVSAVAIDFRYPILDSRGGTGVQGGVHQISVRDEPSA